MRFILLLVFLAAWTLTGCSPVPTPGEGRKVLSMKWAEEARVTSFRVTRTEEIELLGQKIYRMSYEGEIQYTKDTQPILFLPGHKKGDKEKVSGTLTFIKKEKGWEGEDGQLY